MSTRTLFWMVLGNRDLRKMVLLVQCGVPTPALSLNDICRLGYISLLKQYRKYIARNNFALVDVAAGNGHLEIVVWLMGEMKLNFSINAFYDAVQNEHLEIVKCLYRNRDRLIGVRLTTNVLKEMLNKFKTKGVRHNYIDMVNWFNEILRNKK